MAFGADLVAGHVDLHKHEEDAERPMYECQPNPAKVHRCPL